MANSAGERLARLEEKYDKLKEDFAEEKKDCENRLAAIEEGYNQRIGALESDNQKYQRWINQSRGGLFIIMGAGAFFVWLTNKLDDIRKFLGHLLGSG